MSGPQHDIDEVGKLRQNVGHRSQHMFDALVGREQPERQCHWSPFDAELLFIKVRLHERSIGNSVGDPVDLPFRDAINLLQKRLGPLGHDDDAGGEFRQLDQNPALVGVRLAQHRVQGGDDGHPQVPQKTQDVTSRRASIDPILVL